MAYQDCKCLLILLACVCWGFENNCTRKISSKDPLEIVLLKGIFSGLGSLVIGLIAGERIAVLWSVFAVLGVRLVAYGLSIFSTFMHSAYSAPPGPAPTMPLRPLSGPFSLWRSSENSPFTPITSRSR